MDLCNQMNNEINFYKPFENSQVVKLWELALAGELLLKNLENFELNSFKKMEAVSN